MNKRDNLVKWSIIGIFVILYILVSCISTIHVIDFFRISNPEWLAITLAVAFEIGAAACLGAIVILDRTSRWLVWSLFILITVMQMMGNMYYAYSHMHDFNNWIELFGLNEEEPMYQKRILSIFSGAILPIVALGFIKSLVDYIRPSTKQETVNDQITDSVTQIIEPELEIEIEPELKKEDDKISKVEKKIAKVISNNPELKDRISEEIKKLDEDKYTKPEENGEEQTPRKIFGGM